MCEEKGGLGSDAALSAHEFVYAVEGDVERAREFGLREVERVQEFLREDGAGMNCDAGVGQHGFLL